MNGFFKKIERLYSQSKLRKEYTRLRMDAIEAQKSGDIKKSLVLNARADKMLDQVIYF